MFFILQKLHIVKIAYFGWAHLKKTSFLNSYSSLRLTHNMILPFSNNCDKKLIFLSRNFSKYVTASSVLMQLLYYKKKFTSVHRGSLTLINEKDDSSIDGVLYIKWSLNFHYWQLKLNGDVIFHYYWLQMYTNHVTKLTTSPIIIICKRALQFQSKSRYCVFRGI